MFLKSFQTITFTSQNTSLMDTIVFNEMTEGDLPFVKEVYEYYIANSTATFHIGDITIDEIKEFIHISHPRYKSFTILYDKAPAGYCYFNYYKKRQAYDRTAEVTLYLKPEFCGKGIGRVTMQFLQDEAKKVGLKNLLGVISGDNHESIVLFEKMGYSKCAHFKNVGEKFDRLLDVVVYQKEI
jgi:phosphinothricin acetyltransferase